MRTLPRRSLALLAALLIAGSTLSLLLLAAPPAAASPSDPVGYPNPNGVLATTARDAAVKGSGTSAYAQQFGASYSFTAGEPLNGTEVAQTVVQLGIHNATVAADFTYAIVYDRPAGSATFTLTDTSTSGVDTSSWTSYGVCWQVTSFSVASHSDGEPICGGATSTLTFHGTASHTYSGPGQFTVAEAWTNVSGLFTYYATAYVTVILSLGWYSLENVSVSFAESGFSAAGGTTWLNYTGATLPDAYYSQLDFAAGSTGAATLTCGTHKVAVMLPQQVHYQLPYACPTATLDWGAGNASCYSSPTAACVVGYGFALIDAKPTFTLTVHYLSTTVEDMAWGNTSDHRESANGAVTFTGGAASSVTFTVVKNTAHYCSDATFGLTCLGAKTTTQPTAGSTGESMAWWVPYPVGNWLLTSTLVTELDTNTSIASSNFTVTQAAILLEWSNFPVVSANVTEHFAFSLLSLTPLGTTGPPGGEVVLTLGNESAGSPYSVASASWENYASESFTGDYYLEGSWLADATGITLYANGVLVPSYEYLHSGASITVYSGYVPVATRATVTFVAHFVPAPQVGLTSPKWIVDGVPLTYWSFVMLGGVGASLFVVYAHFERDPEAERPGRERSSVGGLIFGILLFAAGWAVVLSIV